MQKVINAGAAVVAVICLAVTFLAAGYVVCEAPEASTRALAEAFVTDDISPFTHDELVKSAVAVRDYCFGSHDKDALYEMMWDINESCYERTGKLDTGQLKVALDREKVLGNEVMRTSIFSAANERYVLDGAAVEHLDDVYNIACAARIPLLVILILGIAAAAHVGVRVGRRQLGGVLAAAGGLMLALMALAGVAAAIDFYAFFQVFHSLFFTGESWIFSYDCLLICSLPENFWMGMGAIWLTTTAVLSILSLCVGIRLRRKKKSGKTSSRAPKHAAA